MNFALPSKFQLTFDPAPQEPNHLFEAAIFVAGIAIGALLATCFPIQ